MIETLHSREKTEVQKAILDLFATVTGLPIALYEERGKELLPIISPASLSNYRKHCKLIQTFPGGKAACEADQCGRADGAIRSKLGTVAPCHAGMYNDTIPIVVKGETRGVLLYGQMQIDSDEHRRVALEKHEAAVKQLGLSSEQACELRTLLFESKTFERKEIDAFNKLLVSFEKWFYTLIDEEDQVTFGVERVTHEIQTRLQAVVANAENLANFAWKLRVDEVKEMARDILSSAQALDTVIQTLGGYLGEYRFKPHSVYSVLREAKRIYESEAASREIEIRLEPVQGDRPANISLTHFQHAINNMVHNAVKYSFRGGQERERYVRIAMRPLTDGYSLSISNYGVGILPEEIKNRAIFQKDYQGKLTQGEYRTGSGKGLFFAESVILRHQGRIEVFSKHLTDEQSPEGKPHHNNFTIFIPYRRSGDS